MTTTAPGESPGDPGPFTAVNGSGDEAGRTLWHGRFASGPSEELLAYTVSLPFDQRLYREDIVGSSAHVRGLARVGLLTADEAQTVLAALDTTRAELDEGTFRFVPSDEDIHTAIERRVTEIAGPAGAKLHTGRSRNDQIATDLRLYTKVALTDVGRRVLRLQATLLRRADEAGDQYLPGYTHLQRAQPVLLAHHLLAHAWSFARDVDRIIDARRRLDVSPLGAGALAGSSLPLDPDGVAADLGFAARFENSLDVTSDRDFVAESLFALVLLGVHLSRIAELARGKAGRLIGDLAGLLATLKGLPLAYNRDLQEDKEPLFDAVDQISLALSAVDGMVATLTFVEARMQAAADSPYGAAIDLAEHLVVRGVPFREAHAIVGALVRRALEGEGHLADLVAAEPMLGADGAALLLPGVAVRRRTTPGGAGPVPVAVQRERFRGRLALDQSRVG
jgi:argininosuccinate lyase